MVPAYLIQLHLAQQAYLQKNYAVAYKMYTEAGDLGSWLACMNLAEYYYSGPERYPGVPPVDMKQAFKLYKKAAELLDRETSVLDVPVSLLFQNLGGMFVGSQVTVEEFRPCVDLLRKFAKGKQHVRIPATESMKCKYWAYYALAHFAYDTQDRPLAAKRYRSQLKVWADLPQDFTQHPGFRATHDIAQDNLKRMYGEMPTLLEFIRLDSNGEDDSGKPSRPRFAVVQREVEQPIRAPNPAELPADCSWRNAPGTVTVNAPTLQRPRCAACGKADVQMQRCSRCKAVSYCGRECQAADWKAHKPTCKKPKA
jgi:hypothetical protein